MFLANYVNAIEKNINVETAYLAGGCYWGLEELIRKLPGVINTKVGFSGDYGGSYFMTQLVGLSKAKELYFLSDKITADEALKLGLTNWIVKHEELEEKTFEIAKQLAQGPSVAFRYMKENLNRAVSGEVDDCLDLEVTHHVHCGETEDHKNATKAFVEKKQPVFKGR